MKKQKRIPYESCIIIYFFLQRNYSEPPLFKDEIRVT